MSLKVRSLQFERHMKNIKIISQHAIINQINREIKSPRLKLKSNSYRSQAEDRKQDKSGLFYHGLVVTMAARKHLVAAGSTNPASSSVMLAPTKYPLIRNQNHISQAPKKLRFRLDTMPSRNSKFIVIQEPINKIKQKQKHKKGKPSTTHKPGKPVSSFLGNQTEIPYKKR